jgi:hypothetical protein
MENVHSKLKVCVAHAEYGTRRQSNGSVTTVLGYVFGGKQRLDWINLCVYSVIAMMLNILNTNTFIRALGLCVQIAHRVFLSSK